MAGFREIFRMDVTDLELSSYWLKIVDSDLILPQERLDWDQSN